MNNPFAPAAAKKRRFDPFAIQGMRIAAWIILGITAAIFLHIIWKGAPVVFSKDGGAFLSRMPETLHVLQDREGTVVEARPSEVDAIKQQWGSNLREEKTISYSGGGILGPIVGTVLLVIGSITVALILGIGSAIYLSEYAKRGKFIEAVRLAILNLAGVPSVVFGLFGVGVFVLAAPRFTEVPLERSLFNIPLGFTNLSFEGWDTSVLSGAFTLAFVVLPVIITASEECLRAVPQGFRETSLALGATRWQTIRRCVLPYAMPGILTSSVLGIARAAGETAPIMFTAAIAYKDKLPWQSGSGWWGVFTESVQALPYHIYTLAARIPQNEYSSRAQYGSVFVFLVIVMSLAMSSILLRRKLRAKYQW
jgi:phosphate transport system permease protein